MAPVVMRTDQMQKYSFTVLYHSPTAILSSINCDDLKAFAHSSRIPIPGAGISLQARAREVVVFDEGPVCSDSVDTPEDRFPRHQRRAEAGFTDDALRCVSACRGCGVPEGDLVIADVGVITEDWLVSYVLEEGERDWGYGRSVAEKGRSD